MESILKSKSFDFAKAMVSAYRTLVSEEKEFVMSKQLLRSGTAIGAMIREAQNAESRLDFIHKLGVAQKECDETMYWLELLADSDYISKENFKRNFDKAAELLRMIKSSILTAKQNLNTSR